MKSCNHLSILLIAAAVLIAAPAAGQDFTDRPAEPPAVSPEEQAIVPQQMSGAMAWEINVPADQVFLRVVGPSGEVYSKRFIAPEKPHYGFIDSKGTPLPDGKYSYEIIAPRSLSSSESLALADAAATAKSAWQDAAQARRSLTRSDQGGSSVSMAEVRRLERIAIETDRQLEELRDQIRKQNGPFAFKRGGTFTIENGAVATPEEPDRKGEARSSAGNLTSGAPEVGTMDFTDSGDIMAGSGLAAGNTSTNPDDGALELWATKPTIVWQDTTSFDPTWTLWTISGDWTLDNSNLDVLRIDSSAPRNSLRIDENGNVGLGTSAPSRELHISSANPEIRLFDTNEVTAAGITYDAGRLILKGNGATNVFAMDGSAPADSLFIDSTGKIGIGTSLPVEDLHIADSVPAIRLEDTDTGGATFELRSFEGAPEFQIRNRTRETIPFAIEDGATDDSLRIESDSSVNITGGTEANPSLIFGGDDNTGFYLDGPDVVGLSAGGVQRFRVTAAGTNIYDGRLAAQSGSEGFPSFTFITDSDTGMWNPLQDALSWTINGTQKMFLNSSGLQVFGNLSKSSGSFKIDHPLDPANKYLYHSFVESPDMMNIYNGNVTLDEEGRATVVLPEWFEALNGDYRYQLTPIGKTDDVLYIEREIQENSFVIAGGDPGTRVSWQVTGVRMDPYAVANRIRVEENKPLAERGTYLFPGYYDEQKELASNTVSAEASPEDVIAEKNRELHELKTENEALYKQLQQLTKRMSAVESVLAQENVEQRTSRK